MILKDFILNNGSFALGTDASDWKDAVKKGVDLLVKAGAAEEHYYDGILKMVEEHGPYFVISPGVAMPHARPELGGLKTGFALVTLKNPVKFGHESNDPVDIVLCICAKDASDMNEEVILNAVTLFDDEHAVCALRRAKNADDLALIFDGIEELE
ncbi:MAG: PTS sugar transporter subunit IIA [Treponema sp.]